jgi:hypothetical protein
MRLTIALLSCLLMGSAGSLISGNAHKPSRDLTAGGASGPARTTLDDAVAWSEEFEYEGLLKFSLLPSPWRWQQLKGRPAQAGVEYRGSVVEQEGDNYLILNTKCAKRTRFFFFEYCEKKKENFINFRRPFEKTDLNQKDCCGGRLVRVVQR